MIPKIVITMEGGVIQEIDSNLPVKIIILDFNTEDGTKDTFTNLEGDKQEAVVQVWSDYGENSNIVEHIYDQIGKKYEL